MGWLHWLGACCWIAVWALAVRALVRTPTTGLRWACVMFSPLALAAVIAAVYPAHGITDPQGLVTILLERIVIALVLGFPVALFQFAAALTGRQRGSLLVGAGYFLLLVPVFFVPPDIADQRPAPWWLTTLTAATAFWFLATTATASFRLLAASARGTAVVAQRLRLLGVASLILSSAVALSAIRDPQALTPPPALGVATDVMGLVAALLFAVALAPPRQLVALWREPQLAEFRSQTPELLTMSSRRDVIERIVTQVAHTSPSGRAGFLARDQRPVWLHGISEQETHRPDREVSRVLVPVGEKGYLAVWPDVEDWPLQRAGQQDVMIGMATILGLALSGLDLVSELREELDVRRTTEAVLTEQTVLLRRAKRDVEEFLALAGHDLASPVRSIRDNVGYLRHDLPADTDPQVRADLVAIERGSQRLGDLVRGLQSYALAREQSREPTHVELRAIVDRVLADLRPDLLGVGADVRVGPLGPVRADPGQLGQVLTALIDNAIRYRHPDRSLRLSITAERHDELVVVRVQDNGRGVAPGDRERVFDMFTRLGDSAGSGVGLALCQRIVEGHGGTIEVLAAEPEGSIFSFSLPMQAAVRI